jgi:predicted Ser/Thr protein kinase
MRFPPDRTPSLNPVDDLIAAYLEAIETGRVPDRRAYLDQNPDQAEALQAFFGDYDRMDRVAAPLRMTEEQNETADVLGTGLTHLPTIRYFGDYELLEEVARGGMGVIYKARQTSLNRLVALKMILAGTFASPREVARFQAEAEAAANLDHPGIVPVYEVGEDAGQQYFSMKFIEGGSLATHPRAEIKAEVLGLIAIARAVHHAHQHGVLHRDLKPSNVLVDPSGNRHVTDFGLAKRLTDIDRSLTEAGQLLGTPRYMSPEQAQGRKDLTVAADVYALGVILFERLTGRTPFDASTALELLCQVREVEPPRPSSFQPAIDRDLETIVLKTLEKDPTRRYPSAEDLTQDLTHWLEGRPITARPVGQGERFVRWCRRNPVVASLSASVALALVLGATVSSLFAYQERKARIRAETAEIKTEKAFARSLVRPFNIKGFATITDASQMGPDASINRPNLSEPEVEALWELTGQSSESLRERFLDEAIREPLAFRQLQARSEPALIAALGFDPTRRAWAVDLLFNRFQQADLKLETKVDLAFLLLQLEDRPEPRFEEASKLIRQALQQNLPAEQRKSLESRIAGSVGWIAPMRAAELIIPAILQSDNPFRDDYDDPCQEMYIILFNSIATQLDPAEAATVARLIARSSDQLQRPVDQFALAQLLCKFTARIDPAEARTLCGPVARSMAGLLEKKETTEYGPFLSQVVAVLEDLTDQLDPVEAKAICGQAARSVEKLNIDDARDYLFSMARLSGKIGPADAEMIARLIAQTIEKETDERVVSSYVDSLVTVVARLEQPLAASICGPLARSLAQRVENKKLNPDDYSSVAGNVKKLAIRLDRSESSAICGQTARSLCRALGRNFNLVITNLNSLIITLTDQLTPEEASITAKAIVQDFGLATNARARSQLAKILSSLARRLDPTEAAALCGPLARSISQSLEQDRAARDMYHLAHLANALVSVTKPLEEAEAVRLCRPVARKIANELMNQNLEYIHIFMDLVESLASLSACLERSEADELCAAVFQSIARSFEQQSPDVRYNFVTALTSLSTRLTPSHASAYCGSFVRMMMDLLMQNPGIGLGDVNYTSDFLNALTSRLGPAEAAITVRSFLRLIEQGTDATVRSKLAYDLSSFSPLLEPAEAVSIARLLVAAVGRETDREVQFSLARALVLFSARSRNERSLRVLTSVLQFGPGGVPTSILQDSSNSAAESLTSQEFVELLKMPTLFGEGRRVVLDELGRIHGRRFANHWQFVRFAEETSLKLDFTTPPRRPERQGLADSAIQGRHE